MKKLLPKRKPERKPSDEEFALRKSTAALEEDAQILKVIEAYCTSAKTRQTLNSSSRKESAPQVLLPEEEKIIVEETKSNGQTVIEEKSLVDTVYALKDEVQELRQDNKKMKKSLEEEQRARKDLEKLVRRVLKNMNDPAWDETNLWGMALVPSEDQLQDQAWSPAIQAGVTCGITGQGRMKGILLSVHRKAGDYLENRNGHTAPKESKREVQTPRAGPR